MSMGRVRSRLEAPRPLDYDNLARRPGAHLTLTAEAVSGFSPFIRVGPAREDGPSDEAVKDVNPKIDVEAYYRRYGPMVLRRCRRMLGNEERARDALQEVFVRLLAHRGRLRHRFPSSLLFRMATNVCLNMIRDARPQDSSCRDPLVDTIAAAGSIEPRAIVSDLLQRLFKKERPSTREVVYLHFVDGMSLREVARETGLSPSGVRKRIVEFRARASLKKELFYGR